MIICRTLLRFLCGVLLVALAPVVGAAAAPGNDGPLAKVGPELQALYEAYRAARESGRPLVLSDPAIRVVEGRVTIDAVAADSVEDLKVHLLALGMRQVATAGRIVSGQLPIDEIPAMAALPSLRFVRAARSTTNDRAGQGVR
jgi:hypothetical protein